MAIRFYLVPKIGTGVPHFAPNPDPWRPKYMDTIAGRWQAMDYGREPVMLVRADVTGAEHTSISANADVVAAPANLNNVVNAQVTTVRARLEAVGIPGDWVASGMSYRTVLRWVARIFLLAQRLNGRHTEALFQLAENLDTLVSSIPAQRRANLANAAESLGLDTSGITGAMTMRQALKLLGDQIQIPIRFNGEDL